MSPEPTAPHPEPAPGVAPGVAPESAPESAPGLDVNLPLLITASITSVLLLLAMIFGIEAWFEVQTARELERKSLAQVSGPLADLRREQQQRMQTYRWIDPAKGVVAIPIERAMELVVKEQKGSGLGADDGASRPRNPRPAGRGPNQPRGAPPERDPRPFGF